MAFATFCQAVRSRWQILTQQLWPDAPEQRTERELARLKVELARRYRQLLQRRCRIEQVRARLAEQERQIELSLQALEAGERSPEFLSALARLRHAARRNRDRLRQSEEAYGLQLQVLERKKHLRLALLRGEMVVLPASAAE